MKSLGNYSAGQRVETQSIWQKCIARLQNEMAVNEFNIWIRPLQAEIQGENLSLFAPNRFVLDYINNKLLTQIHQCVHDVAPHHDLKIHLKVGSIAVAPQAMVLSSANLIQGEKEKPSTPTEKITSIAPSINRPNPSFTFENFVEGKSNQLARAAAVQVAEHPGQAYNPLFLYGGVGLGKTHLMQAVGNFILTHQPNSKVLYVHSERFVADMVKALQRNAMNDFKLYYRGADALLIDDIQFFAGKDRTQEEFFHTFNSLFDAQQQIVMTCDRYPKEIQGLEERLKSRFGWGLTVAIEPPELETRVAILISKAEQSHILLSQDVAFFIAKRVQSNVRELEGALKRVIANAHFTGQAITVEFARDALKDLLAVQAKLVSIDNIQKTVADYYKIKHADLLAKRRNRFLVRARQMAMMLAKELTDHSLPEIGEAFGGRDHTTVMHSCRAMKDLLVSDVALQEDYTSLMRILST